MKKSTLFYLGFIGSSLMAASAGQLGSPSFAIAFGAISFTALVAAIIYAAESC